MASTGPKSKRFSGDGTRTRRHCPDAMLGGVDRPGDLFGPSPREEASDQELIESIARASDIEVVTGAAKVWSAAEILERRLESREGGES